MSVERGGTMIRGDDVRRFWSKTKMAGECLEWTGTLTSFGYGKFMTGAAGKQVTWVAHRWIFNHVNGSLPAVVRHRCDNPRCVNPDHLEAGTQLDNVHDAMDRKRRPSVLTEAMVRRLRSIRNSGGSIRAEAFKLGVAYHTAYGAAVGANWKHVK